MKCSSDFCGGFTLFLRSHASKGDVIQFTPLLLIVVLHSVMWYTNFLSCMYLKLLSWSVHLGRLGECCIFREVCILCCRSIMSFHHYLNPAWIRADFQEKKEEIPWFHSCPPSRCYVVYQHLTENRQGILLSTGGWCADRGTGSLLTSVTCTVFQSEVVAGEHFASAGQNQFLVFCDRAARGAVTGHLERNFVASVGFNAEQLS